jgi:hypothetical protein
MERISGARSLFLPVLFLRRQICVRLYRPARQLVHSSRTTVPESHSRSEIARDDLPPSEPLRRLPARQIEKIFARSSFLWS